MNTECEFDSSGYSEGRSTQIYRIQFESLVDDSIVDHIELVFALAHVESLALAKGSFLLKLVYLLRRLAH